MTTETAPAQRTSTRRRWWPIVVGFLVAVVVGATAAVLVINDDEPATVRVTFEASGPGATPVLLAWGTPEERWHEEKPVPALPWSRTVETSAREGVLFVQLNSSVFADTFPAGPFTCRILVDGRPIVQVPSSAFARCWTTMQRVFAGTTP